MSKRLHTDLHGDSDNSMRHKKKRKRSTDLTVGSMVEVERDGRKTGVIKWIDYDSDSNNQLAGLEMDEDTNADQEARCGKLNGRQMFSCEEGKGLFVSLKECKPDRRFVDEPTRSKISKVDVGTSNTEKACLSCDSNYPLDELHSLTFCECLSCTECFRNAFRYLIQEKSVLEWTCQFCRKPDLSNPENRASHFNFVTLKLQNHLANEPDLFQLFTRKLNQWNMQETSNFIWCSHKNCGNGFFWEGANKAQCSQCNRWMCKDCKVPWAEEHTNRTCQAYKVWLENQVRATDKPKNQLETVDVIACPNCPVSIELVRGGCIHFKCTQCLHEFCSGCLKQFKSSDDKGLSCQHPRDCFYYLRDWMVNLLEEMLQANNVSFQEGLGVSNTTCPINITKEDQTDTLCAKDVVKSGLCEDHYKEHLVKIINKHRLDPVDWMNSKALVTLLNKQKISFDENAPVSALRNLIKRHVPLQSQPYR